MGPIDGTVVPSATGGSLAFLPGPTLRVLKNIKNRYGDRSLEPLRLRERVQSADKTGSTPMWSASIPALRC